MKCPRCNRQMCGVEYNLGHPEQYDGVSEWRCNVCDIRIGNWTKRELKEGEDEPRYGKLR